MSEVRVIEIHEDAFHAGNVAADELRMKLGSQGICMINVMSSPGSGKTTALSTVINMLKDQLEIGLMDVDIKTSLDAKKVADLTGVRSIQIHNGGLCHIDADMTRRAVDEFGVEGLDLLFLENIGNLVCPAEFDTGAHFNMMILSVPEGHDKPLKYPLMFSVCDLVLISKIDTMDYFDFDIEEARKNILNLNPLAKIIPISAKTGQGMDEFKEWIIEKHAQLVSGALPCGLVSSGLDLDQPGMAVSDEPVAFDAPLISYKFVDGTNKDFVKLSESLEDYLNDVVGGADKRKAYKGLNALDGIHEVLLAYDGDKAVGCSCLKPYNSQSVMLKRVYVAPEYRGHHISSNILKMLELRAKELGFTKMLLQTRKECSVAVKLYESLDYKLIANFPPYDKMPEALCYEKDLANVGDSPA